MDCKIAKKKSRKMRLDKRGAVTVEYTLILLAAVEVFKTTLTYVTEGRVKVTFIVDTILVVMLTEVISQWFKGGDIAQMGVLGGILVTLAVIRVLAVRCSPTQGEPVREAA